MVPIKILIVVAAIIVCLGILKFQEKIVRLFGKIPSLKNIWATAAPTQCGKSSPSPLLFFLCGMRLHEN